MSTTLGRGQTPRLKTVTVEIPESEISVILRELSWASMMATEEGNTVLIDNRLALMIVDENGELVYQTPEEIATIKNLSATIYSRLIVEAGKLNEATADAIRSMAKNSQASQAAPSA